MDGGWCDGVFGFYHLEKHHFILLHLHPQYMPRYADNIAETHPHDDKGYHMKVFVVLRNGCYLFYIVLTRFKPS